MFRKKTKQYHAAAGEIRRYREQTDRLHAHRVRSVSNTRYAVLHGKIFFASSRVEETRSFSRNFGSPSQNFVKKIKQYHAAAGESGFHLVKRPV